MDLKEVVAINLRRLRHARRWTQEELGERSGLTARYIGAIERGERNITLATLARIANAAQTTPVALLKSDAPGQGRPN